jgi:peptidylprolyl isomerase
LCLLLNSGNGVGGESIYGAKFEDESFDVLHNKRYLVSMANMGPNTNGSQFFINTVKTSWLDGKNVVFGMVMQGSSVVDKIEKLGTNSGTPKGEVVVIDSGEI